MNRSVSTGAKGRASALYSKSTHIARMEQECNRNGRLALASSMISGKIKCKRAKLLALFNPVSEAIV
jgi:hypothetical protein